MPSIKEIFDKIKTPWKIIIGDKTVFIIVIILTVAFCSFGLGRLSKIEEHQIPILIQNNNLATISNSRDTKINEGIGESQPVEVEPSLILPIGGKYVGSKNSDKYHAPWCSGAQRIKAENQIWFESKEEAEAAGYTPASNCKGI